MTATGLDGPARLLANLEAGPPTGTLPRADVAVVDSLAMADRALRPRSDHERSLVKPGAEIQYLARERSQNSSLGSAIAQKGLRISTSRCGDFGQALRLLEEVPWLQRLAEQLVTHHFDATELGRAFAVAADQDSVKVLVHQHEKPRAGE
jgi:hypothetical protein